VHHSLTGIPTALEPSVKCQRVLNIVRCHLTLFSTHWHFINDVMNVVLAFYVVFHKSTVHPATGFRPPLATVVSAEPFSHRMYTAVPAEGNSDLQTLICVLVVRPRLCLTLSNPVP